MKKHEMRAKGPKIAPAAGRVALVLQRFERYRASQKALSRM